MEIDFNMSIKQDSNLETPNLDQILSSHTTSNAKLLTAAGKWATVLLNAATSYAFGYYFAPLFTSPALVGTLRLSGVVGGVACLLLTDAMARIWDVARSQASESPAQQKIAKAGYLVSFVASIAMTLIYLSVAIFGQTPAAADGFVMVGRTIFTLLAVLQLILFAFYDQSAPHYMEKMIRTTSKAAVKNQILEMEASALLKTAQLVRSKLAGYIEPHADQVAKDVVIASLAQLGYEPERLVNLPSKTLADMPVASGSAEQEEPATVDVDTILYPDSGDSEVSPSPSPFRLRKDGDSGEFNVATADDSNGGEG